MHGGGSDEGSQRPGEALACVWHGLLLPTVTKALHHQLDSAWLGGAPPRPCGTLRAYVHERSLRAASCMSMHVCRSAGGPGMEAPRPFDSGGWLRSALSSFRVVYMGGRPGMDAWMHACHLPRTPRHAPSDALRQPAAGRRHAPTHREVVGVACLRERPSCPNVELSEGRLCSMHASGGRI